MKKGFTLLEITVVIGLIVILATIALIVLNPWAQLNKANDGRRKNDLSTLRSALEDWYNDKLCYPEPSQICYDPPVNNTCHICGNSSLSPSFTPYLSTLVCDPQYPAKNYLYQYDDANCPTSYQIFAILGYTADPAISEADCQNGCGPTAAYNYGISSSNSNLQTSPPNPPTGTPTPTPNLSITPGMYYCQNIGNCSEMPPNKICDPSFSDPFCGSTNGCQNTVSNCVLK